MLKRLRIQFVGLTMAMVAFVLAASCIAICVLEYRQATNEVYQDLEAHLASLDAPQPFAAGSAPAPPIIGGKPGGNEASSMPIAVYRIDNSGNAAIVSSGTASIDYGVLVQALEYLGESPAGQGSIASLGLLYAKHVSPDGIAIAFADTSAIDGWKKLAGTTALVGMGAFAVLFVASIFFSRWVLRPVDRAWTQQRQFIADASHELKTPLTVILANTSILAKHPDKSIADQSQWVESTHAEAKRMQGLVEDMLALAASDNAAANAGKGRSGHQAGEQRIGAGRTGEGRAGAGQAGEARVDFSEVVARTALQLESVAFEQKVALESDIEEGIALQGDSMHLQRLVSTLVDNALKYADSEGVVRITLKTSHGAQEPATETCIRPLRRHAHAAKRQAFAELAVYNSGAAIPPEDLPRIFDRFYRADKARSRDAGGFGLGLAIARSTVESHGGTITAESLPGAGTTFTARLPLAYT